MSLKILIVGSNGFIGSNTVTYLTQIGHDVYTADINENSLKKHFTIDSNNPDFDVIFNQIEFDICINASGAASVPLSFEHTKNDFKLNTYCVFLMLDSIKRINPSCKYINISSAAVYGNPDYLPVPENVQLKPESPYGYHKLMSEYLCEEYHEIYKIKTCSVRIFSAYGPGLKKQLFWDLHQKSKKDLNIEMFGDGTETRDFIYIKDVVKSLEKIIYSAPFLGDRINLGNGVAISIKDATNTFLEVNGNINAKLNFKGKRLGDPNHWQANIQKLKDYGYSQSYSLKDGLQEYSKWLSDNNL